MSTRSGRPVDAGYASADRCRTARGPRQGLGIPTGSSWMDRSTLPNCDLIRPGVRPGMTAAGSFRHPRPARQFSSRPGSHPVRSRQETARADRRTRFLFTGPSGECGGRRWALREGAGPIAGNAPCSSLRSAHRASSSGRPARAGARLGKDQSCGHGVSRGHSDPERIAAETDQGQPESGSEPAVGSGSVGPPGMFRIFRRKSYRSARSCAKGRSANTHVGVTNRPVSSRPSPSGQARDRAPVIGTATSTRP